MAKASQNLLSPYLKKLGIEGSFPSLILGAVVVVILALLVVNFLSRRQKPETGMEIAPTTEEEAQERAPTPGEQYKVKAGDSLSKISQAVYGSQEYWPALATANNLVNPNRILIDSTLTIPPKAEVEATRALMTETSYQVQEGDTLFKIAQKVYGNGSMWSTLAKANKVGRLPNGNHLIFTGSTLTIPR